MALRVWLPLDGDLKNLGIGNYTVVNAGALVDDNGKIGKCYSITSSSQHIYVQNILLNPTCWSAACWFYPTNNSSSAHRYFLSMNTSAANDFMFTLCHYADKWGVRTGNTTYSGTSAVQLEQWTHVAATYDGITLTLYVNGIPEKIQTSPVAPVAATNLKVSGRYNSGGEARGKINDIRVYDHCLSAAEVKEIAQGLVLHYKLDKVPSTITNAYGTPYFDANSANGGWNHWGRAGAVGSQGINTDTQYIYYKDKARNHYVTNSADATGEYLVYKSPAFEGGYRSLQCIVKETNSMPITESILFPTWNNRDGGAPGNKWTRVMPLGNGFYLCQVDGVHQDGNNDLIGFYVCPGYTIYFSFACCENDKQLCSDILFSSTEIQDSSGYNHNGQMIGNINISNDTMRYNTSALFDGVDDCIIVPYNTICPENIFTINLWFKKDALGSKNYETLFGGPSGFEMDTRAGSSTALSLYMAGARGSNAATGLQLNTWYMVTMVRDGVNERYYINGELKKEIEAKAMPNGTYRIGAWASDTGQNYYGNINDFRIYCTPLLDTDIKQLYNVGMKVDKSQNIHTFEINEKNINIFSSTPWTNNFNNHSPNTNPFTNYNSNNEPQFTTNSSSAGSDYIVITPGIYEWNYTVSINAGNQFYIGFERYDADKTSRSNAATVYQLGFKPSEDLIKKRFFGTVDLSTDGVNPIKYIALRILNGWSGTTSGVIGQATIHNFSLRLQSAAVNPKITKACQLISDEFKEYSSAKFYKDHIIEANQFIER